MKIYIDLTKDFGRDASISFEDKFIDAYPDDLKKAIAFNINALLTAFGGLTTAVIDNSVRNLDHGAHPLMDRLMENLEAFTRATVQEMEEDIKH